MIANVLEDPRLSESVSNLLNRGQDTGSLVQV